jgi:probable FeS assembly SUF system protein SufT
MQHMAITVDQLKYSDEVTFLRDCEVTQIPSGAKTTAPAGTQAIVTQTLGGNVTLSIPTMGLLAQVIGRNVEALQRGTDAVISGEPTKEPNAALAEGPADEKEIWTAMKSCYDPEIPLNIVDLGLIYDVSLTPVENTTSSRVGVKMTLTAMGCGMGPAIAAQVRDKIMQVPGVADAHVDIVWDPPWNQSMISDEGKKRLGLW